MKIELFILVNLFIFVKNIPMKDRLSKFMEQERLTASRLSEILGVQPATISHILSGRNKPSFEFIEKMLMRFPKVNPDWLLLGKGGIYRVLAESSSNTSNAMGSMRTEDVGSQVASVGKETLFASYFQGDNRNTSRDNTFVTPASTSQKRPVEPVFQEIKGATRLSEGSPATLPNEAVRERVDTKSPSSAEVAAKEVVRIVIFFRDGTCAPYTPQ
ncbi:MAG: helix-turn-helix transcriptional regulator [Alistipes sp.]|nr:helix-turn-helix transcriptional regulator [Alistipes sp.]